MTEAKPFSPVKLICGVISSQAEVFREAGERLGHLYGPIDLGSHLFKFNFTDYYERQMGKNLKRKFLSFERLIPPEGLSEIKLQTNELEDEIKRKLKTRRRVVNLDPGYLTPSALIMATAKNFAHRIPLKYGIYGHLELLFKKKDIRILSWTYPDFQTEEYQRFFLDVRKIYLSQLTSLNNS